MRRFTNDYVLLNKDRSLFILTIVYRDRTAPFERRRQLSKAIPLVILEGPNVNGAIAVDIPALSFNQCVWLYIETSRYEEGESLD